MLLSVLLSVLPNNGFNLHLHMVLLLLSLLLVVWCLIISFLLNHFNFINYLLFVSILI
ncbi:hypothetical protein AGMMS50256_06560 [Betaproteobacteria bacterium]|nr:hypothetical protein AGMMS50256_06560 [Betaproteobacteria bacterium]